MALFDTILGGLAASDTQHAALYQEVGGLVSHAGGVGGLAQMFQQKGLGGLISGWISSGPNPALSGEQVVNVIGRDRVTAIASKAGLSEAQVAAGISSLLPLVIDHLTPHGVVQNHSPSDLQSELGVLKDKLMGGTQS